MLNLIQQLKTYLLIPCIFMTTGLFLISLLGDSAHTQLLSLGEKLYGNDSLKMHYSLLRNEAQQPQCMRDIDVEYEVAQRIQQYQQDELVAVFGVPKTSDIRESILVAHKGCMIQYHFYDQAKQYLKDHPSLEIYRNFETLFFQIFKFSDQHKFSILVLLILNTCTLMICNFLNKKYS